jgi:outer membrane protein assembly factor BamB
VKHRKVELAVLALVLSGCLYALGERLIPTGIRGLSVEQQASSNAHALEVARHREAQRMSPPGPAPAPAGVSEDPRRDSWWTGFRGPHRDGHYRETPILIAWPAAGLTSLWKQPVGGGHASFAIADGRAFTIEQRGGEEVVAAYDVRSGRESWTTAWRARFAEYYGGEGPRATPAWHDGVVYALGAEGELRALDAATGSVRWRTNILDDARAENLEWGVSASPLIVRDTVVVLPAGGGASLAAYDLATGQRRWTILDDRGAYSSPMLATLGGVEQIVVLSGSRLSGVSLDGSRVLWEFPWRTRNEMNIAQPVVLGGDRLFISSGYGMGAALVEIARSGDSFAVRELWRTHRMKNQFTSSVYHDGFIYGLDESILACLDARTGALRWKGGRYGDGQVLLASGHLVVTTDEGDLVLVRATPDAHVEVARSRALDGRTWNHPAVAGGVLLVRNATGMAAFDLSAR